MKKTLKDLQQNKHLHWDFMAYLSKEGDKIEGVSKVSVINYDTEAEALKAVKNIITRPFYHLQAVWECKTCAEHEEQLDLLRKFFNKLHD